jgi:hypothetical protein
MIGLAEVPFEHMLRLSDSTGLYEHARGALPRREHGYCVDDVARGLVVLARQPHPPPELVRLQERYLTFVAHAQTGTGSFHNRMGFDRRWHDAGGTGDWWGRALWGLGSIIARSTISWVREEAWTVFDGSVAVRSASRRAMAFAALGAAEVLTCDPSHEGARRLLSAAAAAIGRPSPDWRWPWPEHRLFYANAVFPDVLIAAGQHLGDESRLADGLHLLRWLCKQETHEGHLSVTPTGGWPQNVARPAFDQQPIEVAALVDACARAATADPDPTWPATIELGVGWFMGYNDLGKSMVDTRTGGCADGLGLGGPSQNQGAESTLALLSTWQQGRAMQHGRP